MRKPKLLRRTLGSGESSEIINPHKPPESPNMSPGYGYASTPPFTMKGPIIIKKGKFLVEN